MNLSNLTTSSGKLLVIVCSALEMKKMNVWTTDVDSECCCCCFCYTKFSSFSHTCLFDDGCFSLSFLFFLSRIFDKKQNKVEVDMQCTTKTRLFSGKSYLKCWPHLVFRLRKFLGWSQSQIR
jgi:hypothetical protein